MLSPLNSVQAPVRRRSFKLSATFYGESWVPAARARTQLRTKKPVQGFYFTVETCPSIRSGSEVSVTASKSDERRERR